MKLVEAKKRQANFELVRIIAMLMVIALHYIVKGNMSQSLSVDGSANNHLWWLVEAFCNVAVNVYVLISGLFFLSACVSGPPCSPCFLYFRRGVKVLLYYEVK